MEITSVRITLFDEERLKGFSDITFDDMFVVKGVKIIKGNDSMFVSMPSRKRPDGTYQDICHPINKEMREYIEKVVLEEYAKALQAKPQEA